MKMLTTTSCNNFTLLFFSLFLFGQLSVIAQINGNEMHDKVYNLTSFSPKNKLVSDELFALTPDEFESNPDFGYLPYGAPCENCYELLDKRTESYRYFVESGSNGTAFYSQQCYGVFNIKNDKGQWIATDPRLRLKSNGVYTAENQAVMPIELNINQKQSSYNLPNGEKFAFNRKIEMLYVSPTMQVTSLGEADWSNYTIGDEGIHIIDAWPNVDIEIKYDQDRIKSNYIIKAPLGYSNGQIAFRDNLSLPSGYSIAKNNAGGYTIAAGSDAKYEFNYHAAYGYDKSGIPSRTSGFNYYLDSLNKQLAVLVPVNWMNDIYAVYPLTIDPAVTSSATYSAGIMYFRLSPGAYCPGNGTAGCTYTLTVPRPANATLTGATFGMAYVTGTGSPCSATCALSDAGVYFTSACGRNPTSTSSFWYCNNPSAYGTCSGTNLDISSLISCYGPACSGNIPFTMHTQRCNCTEVSACNASSAPCASMANNTWSITISGRTLETTTDKTYNVATCSGTTTNLNPLPTNGVPGYTYLWNTGQTTPTITANNATGPYSVVVTDACGIQRTVNFTINCPLSVTLNQFTAEKIDRRVLLQWETASEKNNDYFMIQRAGEDGEFKDLQKVEAIGNSSTLQYYSTYDNSPLRGTSYYRLQIYDVDGNVSTSDVKSVGFEGEDGLKIIPNPNKGNFQIAYNFPDKGKYMVEIYSTRGEKLSSDLVSVDKNGYKEVKLDAVTLPTGIYFVKLHTNNQVLIEKMIVE